MMTETLIFCIVPLALLALFGAACALNAVHHTTTRPAIIIALLCIAFGWALLLFSALDFLLHANPPMVTHIWPISGVLGVFFLAAGNALLYLSNKRNCTCFGCPGRRQQPDHSSVDWWRLVP